MLKKNHDRDMTVMCPPPLGGGTKTHDSNRGGSLISKIFNVNNISFKTCYTIFCSLYWLHRVNYCDNMWTCFLPHPKISSFEELYEFKREVLRIQSNKIKRFFENTSAHIRCKKQRKSFSHYASAATRNKKRSHLYYNKHSEFRRIGIKLYNVLIPYYKYSFSPKSCQMR